MARAQAGIRQIVGAGKHGEIAVAGFDRPGEHAGKAFRPVNRARREKRAPPATESGRQPGAALARRALMTRRHPVAMRARNPWVRLRWMLLGWKVRFMSWFIKILAGKPVCGFTANAKLLIKR